MELGDEEALKKWVIAKLESNGSDADADVREQYLSLSLSNH